LILIILYPYVHEAAEYIQWSSGSQVVVTPVVFTCQVRISISGLLLVACMHYPVSHLWFSHTAYNNFFQQLKLNQIPAQDLYPSIGTCAT